VSVLVARHGLVWVGGTFTTINRNPRASHVAALRPVAGTVSRSFTVRGAPPVTALRVTGSRVYVGTAGVGGRLLVRSRSGRALWSKTFDGDVNSIALLDHVVYVGGHWRYACTDSRTSQPRGDCAVNQALVPRLAALTGAGRLRSWVPRPNSALGVLAMTASPATGTLAVGGAFTTFDHGSISQPAFALLRR